MKKIPGTCRSGTGTAPQVCTDFVFDFFTLSPKCIEDQTAKTAINTQGAAKATCKGHKMVPLAVWWQAGPAPGRGAG
eukprot:SAG11_NODE_26408_length_345_cov_3.987805_1_plen_76_part_10